MRCSVIIPCWNGKELTQHCLASLRDQAGQHDLEILLVDNASSDGTHELAAIDARIRVLRQDHNRGFAGGVNRGLLAATRPFALILNNDTRAAPNLLQELERALSSDSRLGAVAPVSNHVKGPARIAVGQGPRDAAERQRLAQQLATEPVPLQDVETLAGLCLLLPRAAVDHIGLLDERFGAGNYEDDDYCLRLRLHGYRLAIARRAFLFHEGHATFHALGIDLPTELRRRRQAFIAKWRSDPAGRALLASWDGDLATAGAAASAARLRWPQWPDADWHLARAAAVDGDHAAAANHCRALLRHSPRHADAALELGVQLQALGQADLAERQLVWALDHCVGNAHYFANLLLRLGELAFARADFERAAAQFRAATELRPELGLLHHHLAVTLLRQGDWAAAELACSAAIERGVPLAQSHRGLCRLRRGDLRGAVNDCLAAVTQLPDNAIAAQNLLALRQELEQQRTAPRQASAGRTASPAPAGATSG